MLLLKTKVIAAAIGTMLLSTAVGETVLTVEQWRNAMAAGDVDSEVLYAIALKESGTSFNGLREYEPWPWVMNVSGDPRFYSSKAATEVALRRELEAGNNRIDVGMWQINLRYNGHLVDDPVDLVDPVINLKAAAEVLRDCGDRYPLTKDTLSCYHSGDLDQRGQSYAAAVLKLAEKWGRPFVMRDEPVRAHKTSVRRAAAAPTRSVSISGDAPTIADNSAHRLLVARMDASSATTHRVIVLEAE